MDTKFPPMAYLWYIRTNVWDLHFILNRLTFVAIWRWALSTIWLVLKTKLLSVTKSCILFFGGRFWSILMVFDKIEDNVSYRPHSSDHFGIWKHFLNTKWVTDALNIPKKGPKEKQAYKQSRLSLVLNISFCNNLL